MGVLWAIAFVAFAADRLSKRWVASALIDGHLAVGALVWPTWNRGAWVGRPWPAWRLVALWAAAAAAAVVAVAIDGLLASPSTATALGAALGGAAGNLADRLRHGGVFDFLDLRLGGRMPGGGVCNLADFAIVGGLLVATAGELAARLLG